MTNIRYLRLLRSRLIRYELQKFLPSLSKRFRLPYSMSNISIHLMLIRRKLGRFVVANIKTFFCANVKHIFIFDIFLLFLRKWRFLPGPGTAVLKNNPSSDENRHKKAFPVDPEIESWISLPWSNELFRNVDLGLIHTKTILLQTVTNAVHCN